MKRILVILVCMNIGYNLYSQPLGKDSLYLEVAKEYIKIDIENKLYKSDFQLSDTNNIILMLPIYNLTDSFCKDKNDYSRIIPFINNRPNPYNQYIFIKQKNNIRRISLTKDINTYLRAHAPIPPMEGWDYCISGINPNMGETYSDYDENIKFDQIEQYIKENPETKVFKIYELTGFWGYKNGKLIKLIFHKDKTEEIDGEYFYRHYLLIRSPKGLERVTKEHEDFIIVITG